MGDEKNAIPLTNWFCLLTFIDQVLQHELVVL